MLFITAFAFAHVEISYPEGGEGFESGQTITITWIESIMHVTDQWDLYFSTDGGMTWDPIIEGIPYGNPLEYDWVIPEILTSEARVRVVQNNQGPNYEDESDNFEIIPGISIEMECPSDLEEQCAGEIPALAATLSEFIAAGGTVDSDCGIDENSFSASENSNGGLCPEIIERTYSITDSCGVDISCTQVITVHDQTPPVFDPPPSDITVQCPGDIPPTVSISWSDNCDGVGSVTGIDMSDGNSCPEIVTRSWTYTDVCGNSAAVTQLITILDDIVPVFATPPADTIVACIEDIPEQEALAWEDNCDGSGTVSPLNLLDGDDCTAMLTRFWSYTDACGNSSVVTQRVFIMDNIPPVIDTPPADITVACAEEIPIQVDLEWSDNCDGFGMVSSVDVSDGNTCPETITRSWSYTDACGNSVFVSQLIVIHDTIPPTVEQEAEDFTMECNSGTAWEELDLWLESNGGSQFTDNCVGPLSMNDVEFTADLCSEPFVDTITFIATDACGNTAETSAIFTVKGTSAVEDPNGDDMQLHVDPLPASRGDIVNISGAIAGRLDLQVFDIYGKPLATYNDVTLPFAMHTATFPSGTYILKAESDRQEMTTRFLIQ